MLSVPDTVIEAQGVGKILHDATGDLAILQDISLRVARGQSVAIVGASGSGKSTLLGLLAGLDLPTHGTVRLLEQSLGELDEEGRAALRRKQVGFVFQSFQLMPHLTALENVMLPLELLGDAHDVQARATHLLERVGLASRLSHYPKQLSGGEQQRVALARAFVSEPAILFADEPTGSLDTATGEKVIDLMFAMNRASGATLVLVTHDPAIAQRCDRIFTLSGGRLVVPAQAAM
ncbi:ABC transporter ATPase [Pandoraea thiooxydans]|uniref:ABC transporter domain-containing protein n=1 Tax=Pandoraea thiooxydans TaxID=445709 RepID=A0A0G3ET87_9BURK|nr:ABC transporter ATP-binding protein [Pandoraea thiooxydans]AKJ67876.1 ABC transporter ATP-binding protein [Pandoraea thiooxydans]APR95071.1 ABC transporter ATPase [Pandoraea thiooxydans]